MTCLYKKTKTSHIHRIPQYTLNPVLSYLRVATGKTVKDRHKVNILSGKSSRKFLP